MGGDQEEEEEEEEEEDEEEEAKVEKEWDGGREEAHAQCRAWTERGRFPGTRPQRT